MSGNIKKEGKPLNTYNASVTIYENGISSQGNYLINAENRKQARIALQKKNPNYLEKIIEGATGFKINITTEIKTRIKKGNLIRTKVKKPIIVQVDSKEYFCQSTTGVRVA